MRLSAFFVNNNGVGAALVMAPLTGDSKFKAGACHLRERLDKRC
jgi:hypothetical protein